MTEINGLQRWGWQEVEGQVVIYCDQKAVFYSTLTTPQNGSLGVVRQFLDAAPQTIHHDTLAAIEQVFAFAHEHNQETSQLAAYMVDRLNAADAEHSHGETTALDCRDLGRRSR